METGGNKPNRARAKVRSQETTVTILKGSPCFYSPDATGDGIDVVSAESLGSAVQGFFAGLAMSDIAPGKYREVLTSGMCEYARIITATRAASTDVWASYAAATYGDQMSIITGTNTVQGLTRGAAGAAGTFPMFALATSYVSQTTQASSLPPAGGTASTSTMRVFLRSL